MRIRVYWFFLPLFAGLLSAAGPRSSVSGFSFDSGSGISNRFITPNGDGLNDSVVFTFANSRDSNISGRIYDIRGSVVASLVAGPAPANPSDSTLKWDGKSAGGTVVSGLYIYVIRGEKKVFSGLLVVIR